MRVRPDGKPLIASSEENKTVPPIEDTSLFCGFGRIKRSSPKYSFSSTTGH